MQIIFIAIFTLCLSIHAYAYGPWEGSLESDYSNEISFVSNSDKVMSWDNPATNTDSSVLTNLGGINIYCGTSSGTYNLIQTLVGGNISSFTIGPLLTPGQTYYCALKAFNMGEVSLRHIKWRLKNVLVGTVPGVNRIPE